MSSNKQGSNSVCQGNTPDKPKNWREWEDADFGSYSHVKHIYNDLDQRDGFSSAEDIAEAAGMGFTKQSILKICRDQNDPIPTREIDGKSYIAVEPFLNKFIGELKWEEVTPSIFPDYEAKMQEVMAYMGWGRQI